MKRLTLDRRYSKNKTLGFIDNPFGGTINTLEPPWLDNQKNISCIPEGDYIVRRDRHGRFKWFTVQDVPNRTYIEFHEGEKPEHSKGCILMSFEDLKTLKAWTGEDSFLLTIKEFEPIVFGG